MKVGDLVTFKQHGTFKPLGVVLEESIARFGYPTVVVHWNCEYTPNGDWDINLLRVVDESR